jgi:hypothetical protein
VGEFVVWGALNYIYPRVGNLFQQSTVKNRL